MPDSPSSATSINADPNTALDQFAESCQPFSVDRLPIVSAFCHKIGIGNSINSSIESNADIDA
ncbi:MAG: hypothetical protein ACI9NC_006279, partial [Verrucomicrobiales bacterium]